MPDWLVQMLVFAGFWFALQRVAEMLPRKDEKVVEFGTRDERARKFAMRRRDAFLAFGILVAAWLVIAWGRAAR